MSKKIISRSNDIEFSPSGLLGRALELAGDLSKTVGDKRLTELIRLIASAPHHPTQSRNSHKPGIG